MENMSFQYGSGGKCSGSDGNNGGDTYIKSSNSSIIAGGGKAGGSDENRKWYEFWKWFSGGGEAGTYSVNNNNINKAYLWNNGNSGDAKVFNESIGGASVMSSNTFKSGIGYDRGYGGSKKMSNETYGNGGCLYILPTTSYCVCTIKAPSGTNINVSVSGDEKSQDGNYIQNTEIRAGNMSGTTTISFIVKKGATINYNARNGYMVDSGSFKAGENLNSDNEQNKSLTLKKEIVTHTIKCSGDFTITGEFTDDNGNITNRELTGTNSITFKVWKDPSHNTVTVNKTYYDSKVIQITENNGTTDAGLNKKRYYASLSSTGKIKLKKKSNITINATWNDWNDEEKAKASKVNWNLNYEGFECTALVKNKTNISYGSMQLNSQKLPEKVTITFSNNHSVSKTFETGNIWVEIK